MSYSNEEYMYDEDEPVRERIVCMDGFSMSVQDRRGTYSTRGVTSEIGFPSEMVPELMEYAESPDNPTGTVYAHVPNELVEAIIDQHGGRATPEKLALVNQFNQMRKR